MREGSSDPTTNVPAASGRSTRNVKAYRGAPAGAGAVPVGGVGGGKFGFGFRLFRTGLLGSLGTGVVGAEPDGGGKFGLGLRLLKTGSGAETGAAVWGPAGRPGPTTIKSCGTSMRNVPV